MMGHFDAVRRDLAAYRRANGVTQQQLAELVGVSRAAVSAFETGASHAMRAKAFDRMVDLIERWRELDRSARQFVEQAAPGRAPGAPRFSADASCPRCREAVPGPLHQAWFCLKCGSPLAIRCAACGHMNPDPNARFCSRCAAPIAVPGPNAGAGSGALIEDGEDFSDVPLTPASTSPIEPKS